MRMAGIIWSMLFVLLGAVPVSAANQIIETVGEYLVGDGETMAAGLEHARKDAIRKAAEQAGTYVRSYSKVRNMALEEDLIEVIASHAMKITTLPDTRQMSGNAVRILVPIRAEILEGELEQTIRRTMKERQGVDEYRQLQERLQQQSAELQALKKRLAEAVAVTEKQVIIEQIGKNELQFRAASMMKEAGELAFRKQFAEARTLMNRVIELTPDDPRAYLRRALVSVAPEEQKLVAADIDTAIRLDPKEGPVMAKNVYLNRAEQYLVLENMPQALAEADKAVSVLTAALPAGHERYLQFLRQVLKLTDEKKIMQLFCRIFEVANCTREGIEASGRIGLVTDVNRVLPHLAHVYFKRAQIRYEAGDVAGAVHDQEVCCASVKAGGGEYINADFCTAESVLKPFSSPAALKAYQFVQQALRFSSDGDEKTALNRLNAAAEIEPGYQEIYFQRGNLLMNQNQHRAALEDFNRLVRLVPKDARSYHYRAMLKDRMKDHAGALADLNKAMKLAPEDSELLRKRAVTYELLQQPDKAAADYLRYAKRFEGSSSMQLQIARELERMGRRNEERQVLERFLRLVRESPAEHGSDQELAQDIERVKKRLRELMR